MARSDKEADLIYNREYMRNRRASGYRSVRWNKEQRRAGHLRQKYGLTLDGFVSILVSQDFKCAICRMELSMDAKPVGSNYPQVDHDHVTGVVRGLLCFACNTGIGKLQDSIEILERAVSYLKGE